MANEKISLPAEVDLVGVKNLNKIAKTLRDAKLIAPLSISVSAREINSITRTIREGLREKTFNLKLGNPVGVRGFIRNVKQSLNEASFDIKITQGKAVANTEIKVNQASLDQGLAQIQQFFNGQTVPLKFGIGSNLVDLRNGLNAFFKESPVTITASGINFAGGLNTFLRNAFKNIDVPLNARIANAETILKDLEARATGGDIAINLTIREKGLGSVKKDVENLEAQIKKVTGGLRQAEFPVNVTLKTRASDIAKFVRGIQAGMKEHSFNIKLGNPIGITAFARKVRTAINEIAVNINVSKANLKNFSQDLQQGAGSVIQPKLDVNETSLEQASLKIQKFFFDKSIPLRFKVGSGLTTIRKALNGYFKENPSTITVGDAKVSADAKKSLRTQFSAMPLPINVKVNNIEKLLQDIRLQVSGKDIPINVIVKQKGVAAARQEIQGLEKSLRSTTTATKQTKDAMGELGEQTALTFRRFGVYTLVTAAFFRFTSAVKAAVGESIEFNDELIKIRQVTGESISRLSALTNEIDRLSTSFGVSSLELINVSRTLSQAGFNMDKTKIILESIAKSDLAATFDNMGDTVEGVIAITSQFRLEAEKVEAALGSINAVSKQFAVESADLITTVRKTGGAFEAAGGSLEELIALFTSVRSTTRESADSIATGFRTIFTRLQRSRTQEFLANLNVELRDFGDEAESLGRRGLFVGPFESVKRLSEALSQITTDDPRFAQVTEELGGFRQISKVIPLVQQFAKAQQALIVAELGRKSLEQDAVTRQESLQNAFTKTSEEFQKMIRGFFNTEGVQEFIRVTLSFTSSLIRLAEALQQVLVPLAAFASAKIVPGVRSLGSGVRRSLVRRNRGGPVPGVGNRDTVEALLTPGEYVLRKEAVKKIGANRLDELNRAKFNTGGFVGNLARSTGPVAATITGVSVLLPALLKLDDNISNLITAIGVATSQFLIFNSFMRKGTDNKALRSIVQATNKTGVDNRSLIGGDKFTRSAGIGLLGNEVKKLDIAFKKNNEQLEKQTKAFAIVQGRVAGAKANVTRSDDGFDISGTTSKLEQQEAANIKLFEQRKEEIQVRQDLILAKKEELNSVKSQIQQFRKTNLFNALETGGLAIATSLIAIGGFLQKRAQAELDRVREGRGDVSSARSQFIGGQTATGTGVGALAAAGGLQVLAKIFPALAGLASFPVVGLIALGIGAIGGGIYSFFKSTQEFEKTLRQIDLDNLRLNLEKTFQDFNESRITGGVAGARLGTQTSQLNRSIMTENDQDIRDSLSSTLQSNAVALSEFVSDIGKTSSTMEEFESKVPISILEALSTATRQPISAFKETALQSIKSAKAAANFAAATVKANNIYQIRIREEQALVDVLSTTVSRVGAISTSITDFPDLQDILSRQLSAPRSIFNFDDFEKRLSNLASAFGETDNLEASILDTVKATQQLPSILLSAQVSDPFGEGSDVRTIVADRLADAGIGEATREAIVAQLTSIIGAESKDANLFEALDKDFSGTIEKITSQGAKFAEPLAQMGQKVNSELSALAQALSVVRSNFQRMQDIDLERVDIRDFLTGIRESIEGSPLLNVRQQNLNRRENILTGGQGANELLQERQRLQESLRAINEDLANNAGSPAEQQRLVNLQSQQIVALTKVNRGLEFLGDVATRSSVLQQKLNEETEKRNKLRNVGDDLIFGGGQDRDSFRQNIGNIQIARTQGIDAVAGDQRKEVLSFLQSLGTATLPILGKAADKVLDDIRRKSIGDDLFKQLNDPTALEKELKARIENMAKESEEVKKAIKESIGVENTLLINGLNTEFTTFLQNLQKVFIDSQNRTIDLQAGVLEAELSKVQATQDVGRNITERTGLDPDVVKNNIDAIRELKGVFQESSAKIENIKNVSDNFQVTSERDPDGTVNLEAFKRLTIDEAKGFARQGLVDAGIDENNLSEILSKINRGAFSGSLGRDGKIPVAAITKETKALIDGIGKEQKDILGNTFTSREDLKDRIGDKAFSQIESNLSFLGDALGSLPPDTSFKNLTISIQNLEEQIKIQNANRLESPELGSLNEIRNITNGMDPKLVARMLPQFNEIAQGLRDSKSQAERASFVFQKNDIIEKIGVGAFDNIASNLGELNRVFTTLPEDVRKALSDRPRPVQRNSGGFIPGSGNRDTVPALLTPGEFVLRKEAVQRLGPNYVREMNKGRAPQKFRTGGLVKQNNSTAQTTSGTVDVGALTAAINRFQIHVQQLSDTLKAIPSEITMRGEHNLNVTFNGAEVFRTMMPQIKDMMLGEINKQMNNMLRQKFPNAGQYRS